MYGSEEIGKAKCSKSLNADICSRDSSRHQVVRMGEVGRGVFTQILCLKVSHFSSQKTPKICSTLCSEELHFSLADIFSFHLCSSLSTQFLVQAGSFEI